MILDLTIFDYFGPVRRHGGPIELPPHGASGSHWGIPPPRAEAEPFAPPMSTDATAGKTDDASKKAVALANEAQALHDAGKHADSVKKAQDAAGAINLQLKMKQ